MNKEPALVLSDAHGIYIPKLWCDGICEEEAQLFGISMDDVEVCQRGPDEEWYWESWAEILDNASVTDTDGVTWRLYQDGDLWEIPDTFDFEEAGWA